MQAKWRTQVSTWAHSHDELVKKDQGSGYVCTWGGGAGGAGGSRVLSQ